MIPARVAGGLVTLREEPVRHPWLATPDELRDHVASERPAPRDVYRWAIWHGWSAEEAGMWAANCAGIPIIDGDDALVPWRLREVQHLEFLRAIVGAGRLAGDTEAGA